MRAAPLLLTCLLSTVLTNALQAASDPSDGLSPAATLERLGGGLEISGSFVDAGDDAPRPTGRIHPVAPVGVSNDHLLQDEQWAVSLRYQKQRWDGLRDSNDRVDEARGYLISPIDHTRRTVRLDALYGLGESVTVRLSLPWVENEMDQQVNLNAERWTTRSKGLGDASLTGLFGIWEGESTRVLASLGVSAPTGSITEEDRTVFSVGADVQLQFPMQLGTGTWDVLPGLTVTGEHEQESWGVQLNSRIHTGENSQGYTRGDVLEATGWWAHHFDESQSASLRLAFLDWDETSNFDDDVPNAAPPAYRVGATPNADPDIQGGQRVDLLLGWNSIAPAESEYAGHRLAVEVGLPIRQVLSGPALETDWILTIGWQKAF